MRFFLFRWNIGRVHNNCRPAHRSLTFRCLRHQRVTFHCPLPWIKTQSNDASAWPLRYGSNATLESGARTRLPHTSDAAVVLFAVQRRPVHQLGADMSPGQRSPMATSNRQHSALGSGRSWIGDSQVPNRSSAFEHPRWHESSVVVTCHETGSSSMNCAFIGRYSYASREKPPRMRLLDY